MKTSAIASPANITQSLSANKPESASADMPFSQVLSRETSKASVRETAAAPQNQAQPATPAKTGNTDKSANSGDAKDSTDAGQTDNASAQDAASAEMLALVANLVQANATPATPVALQSAADAAAVAVSALSSAAAGDLDPSAGLRADLLAKLPKTTIAAKDLPDQAALATPAGATAFQGKLQAVGVADQTTLPQAAALKTAAELPVQPDALPAAPDKATLAGLQDKATLVTSSESAASNLNMKDATVKTASERTAVIDRSAESKPVPDSAAASKKADTATIQAVPELTAIKVQEAPAPSAAVAGQLQQASLAANQAMAANPTEKLTPQVGSPGWDQALGQKVVWMVAGGQQSASLTLNPPDLGPLQVVLNVSNSQATASFTAAQPEVRQALEAALPRLREMLADSGIQLGQTSVGSGAANQFSAPGDQSPQSPRQLAQNAATVQIPVPAARAVVQNNGQGLIDTFA